MTAFKEFAELKNAIRYLRKKGAEPKKDSNEYKNLEMMFNKFKGQYAIGILTSMCECGRLSDGGAISALKLDSEEYKKYTTTGEIPGKMCQHCIQLFMLLQNYFDTDEKELNTKHTSFAAKFLMDLRAGKIELIEQGEGQVELKFKQT